MNFKEYVSIYHEDEYVGQNVPDIHEVDKYISLYGFKRVGDHIEVYHGTSKRRANKIAKEGFKIRVVKNQTMGGDSESSRNYIWFAKDWNHAEGYARLHYQPAIITVRIPVEFLKNNPRIINLGPDSLWIKKEIPLEYISSIESLKSYW